MAPSTDALQRARAFLRSSHQNDGAWGYVPGKPSAVEPTCYAAMALREDAQRGAAVAWLCNRIQQPANTHLQWEQLLALLSLRSLEGPSQLSAALVRRALSIEPQRPEGDRSVNELDANLRGWSWIDGTFSWVEPTSYAILALKAHGHGGHARIREGERLLIDRVCFDGAWNYGNRKVRGEELESMMPTTALGCMALQGASGATSTQERALNLLHREVLLHPSSLSLALTILCFGIYQRPTEALGTALSDRQLPDGSWRHQVHLTALAALALHSAEGGSNVFRV